MGWLKAELEKQLENIGNKGFNQETDSIKGFTMKIYITATFKCRIQEVTETRTSQNLKIYQFQKEKRLFLRGGKLSI